MLFLPSRGGPISYQCLSLPRLVVEAPCAEQESSIDPGARLNQFVWVILAVWHSLATVPLFPPTLYVLAALRRRRSRGINSGLDENRSGSATHSALRFFCRAFPPSRAIRRRSVAESFLVLAFPALRPMRLSSSEERLRARCFPPNRPRLTAFRFFLFLAIISVF